MPIKLLTFDLDNTLWNVDPVIIQAEQASYSWLQQHCPQATDFYTLEAISEYRTQIATCYPDLSFRVSKLREEVLRRVIMQSGIDHDSAADLARGAFEAFYTERNNITLFDGVADTLHALKQQYTLMAITNGNANLQLTGVADFFSAHFSAETFGQPKPLAGMFLAALKEAQTSAQESVHIGDHPEQDIAAAAQVGMHTVWVNTHNEPWPLRHIKPSVTIKRVSELPHALQTLAESI